MSKRKVKFQLLVKLYQSVQQGHLTIEQAKDNISLLNIQISSADFEKLKDSYQDINAESLNEFLVNTNALKKSYTKSSSGNGKSTRLNTPDAAIERGVATQNVEQYLNLVNSIYENIKSLNQLMTKARAVFAIPIYKKDKVQVE